MDVLHKTFFGRISSIHERCLRPIQQNYTSDFEVLLKSSNRKSFYQKCRELFIIEFYEYLNGLSPDIMTEIFKLRESIYNLRNFHIFESLNSRTKKFDRDNIVYTASQNISEEIRNSTSLPIFKKKIKKVPLISCSCNCFRKYIHHVGFI